MSDSREDEDLEREAQILADQADRFVAQFDVDVSNVENDASNSEAFQRAANAYERIAHAEKHVDPARWYQASNVDGREANEIMRRLWNVRERLRKRDEARRHEARPDSE